jgi:hypothetical protein
MSQFLTALQYLNNLRPALPMSVETPCKLMSNGELRRHMKQNAILINGEKIAPEKLIDFPVFSLVFFPNSEKRKTTLI